MARLPGIRLPSSNSLWYDRVETLKPSSSSEYSAEKDATSRMGHFTDALWQKAQSSLINYGQTLPSQIAYVPQPTFVQSVTRSL